MLIKRILRKIKYLFIKRPLKTRRYIHQKIGVKKFFEILEAKNISYVILRWFEKLPVIEPGEDIDLLIKDEDLDKVKNLFKGKKRKGIPCDVYSESGLPGSNYLKMAYFPKQFAHTILQNAVIHKGLYKIPNNKYMFLSMAYHVVYHKGYASGLAVSPGQNPETDCKDHDYKQYLTFYAKKAKIKLKDATLIDLNDLLKQHGYQPPKDLLEKLSIHNKWIKDTFFAQPHTHEEYMNGLTTFIIRSEGVQYLKMIEQLLWLEGFDIIDSYPIPNKYFESAKHNMRGGNWSKGPFPMSGGFPSYVIVAYDTCPVLPSDKHLKLHPGLSNERIMQIKVKVRKKINRLRDVHRYCNVMHSSDNCQQALEYLKIVSPDKIGEIKKKVYILYKEFSHPYTVIERIKTCNKRAKVELIHYNEKTAFCKTYKHGRERFLKRELKARQIGAGLKEISTILESGPNYIVLEKYSNQLESIRGFRPPFFDQGLLPVWIIKRVVEIIKFFRTKGYEYIDLHPKNIIYDPEKGMKIIDFEFLQQIPGASNKTDTFKGNYAWYTIPEECNVDMPVLDTRFRKPYRMYWFKQTGLPIFLATSKLPNLLLSILRIIISILYGPWILLRNIYKKLREIGDIH